MQAGDNGAVEEAMEAVVIGPGGPMSRISARQFIF
jgi:hypothetical protein